MMTVKYELPMARRPSLLGSASNREKNMLTALSCERSSLKFFGVWLSSPRRLADFNRMLGVGLFSEPPHPLKKRYILLLFRLVPRQ